MRPARAVQNLTAAREREFYSPLHSNKLRIDYKPTFGHCSMLDPNMIRRFYLQGYRDISNIWEKIGQKQIKLDLGERNFRKLNNIRNRLNFKSLKKYCVHFAPAHVYMSALNWLMPERVGSKQKAKHAYPVGGEYVVDIDSYLFWRPHSHFADRNGVCVGCLSISQDSTLRLVEKIEENYSDIHIVFSGERGFHVHVLDFNLRDWTHYDERNPLKSHEVARFLYTKQLKSVCGGFDKHHFTLSADVMRVITVPESLNGETGLICSHLGNRRDFEKLSISDILWKSRATSLFFNVEWDRLVSHAHPEPLVGRR